MPTFSFQTTLIRPEGTGTWTFANLPPEVSAAMGSKGQFRIRGSVNGCSFRSTAMPHGDGSHYVVINKSIRDTVGVRPGDVVQLIVEADLEPRTVIVPDDLAEALAGNLPAQQVFEGYSYSHKKEIVDWICDAKRPETRQKRISKAIESLVPSA